MLPSKSSVNCQSSGKDTKRAMEESRCFKTQASQEEAGPELHCRTCAGPGDCAWSSDKDFILTHISNPKVNE